MLYKKIKKKTEEIVSILHRDNELTTQERLNALRGQLTGDAIHDTVLDEIACLIENYSPGGFSPEEIDLFITVYQAQIPYFCSA
ncbi:MAG: hypothetical protein LBJ95_03950 [Oscillospiraceae bacterium]|jgi:hypothetical protein|nr:hypothetical protein [Oscillospiraceae bacterium]